MIALIAIIILLIELAIEIKIYNNILAPPIILSCMWLGVHVLNFLLGWQVGELEYAILIIPPLMFNVGFLTVSKYNFIIQNKNKCKKKLTLEKYKIKYKVVYAALTIDFLFMIINLYSLLKILNKTSEINFWLAVHESATMMNNNIFVIYSVPAAYILSGFCSLLYFQNKNRKNLIIFLLALMFAGIRAFIAGNRSSLFMVIVLNLFPVLLSFKSCDNKIKSYKEQKKLILAAAIITAIMFFGIASQKYTEDYDLLTFKDFIIQNFTGYYNLSSAAFVKWFKDGFAYTYGTNTFRFFFAVLNRLGLDNIQVNSINASYINIEGTVTNAFTVAKNYVEDFGVIFMGLMLMLFGMIHAHFYKKSFKGNIYNMFSSRLFCSAMYIGLLYQVLVDQYMTILSMMINFALWSFIFPRILIKKQQL